jgi:hypothetical protein
MHYSRTNYKPLPPSEQRPVSDLIVEAFRNGHPVWQIAARCQVPRSKVMTVLVQRGEINALDTSETEERAITHVAPPKAEAGA